MSSDKADRGDQSRPDWKDLLRRHNIRPDKRLGQNFLFDQGSLQKVVSAADLTGEELVLEIGAGVGSLTRALARSAGRVVAVEFDRRLLPALREAVDGLPGVELVAGDILSLDLRQLVDDASYRVVANIPYNITSAVIRKLMEADSTPELVVLTVQREVADRIVAEPGDMSLLALSVQVYGVPSLEGHISRNAFYPSPDVDSAVLRIDLNDQLPLTPDEINRLFEIARAGFQQKRKQLRNSLGHGTPLSRDEVDIVMEAAGISPKRRPQALAVEEWIELTRQFQRHQR